MPNQRGQIIPKGDTKYLLRIYLGRDENSKKKYASKAFEGTISQARQALTKMLREKDTDTFVTPTKTTVQQYLTAWLDGKADVEVKTLLDYKHRMVKDVYPYIGGLQLSKLDPAHISVLYGKLRTDRELSPRTIRYTHQIFSQALELAVEEGLLSRNPCKRRIVRQALPASKKTPPAILSIEELGSFLSLDYSTAKYLPDLWRIMRPMLWRLSLLTAMRPQEVLALKWADLRDGAFHISRAIHEKEDGQEAIEEFTKTHGSTRTVDLDEGTIALLQSYRVEQAKEILKAGETYQRNDYVFATRLGTFFYRRNVRRWWIADLTRAKLPLRKWYTTRHTHLSHLLENGENPKAVAERAGHSDASQLLRTYAHTLPGTGKKLANTAASLLLVKTGT